MGAVLAEVVPREVLGAYLVLRHQASFALQLAVELVGHFVCVFLGGLSVAATSSVPLVLVVIVSSYASVAF